MPRHAFPWSFPVRPLPALGWTALAAATLAAWAPSHARAQAQIQAKPQAASPRVQPVAGPGQGVAFKRVPAPAAEQREGTQLQPVERLKASAPATQVRRGVQDPVQQQRQRLGLADQASRRAVDGPSMARLLVATPGIHALNGQARGDFEPGGRYLLEGNGFGERAGTVTLRGERLPPVDLRVLTWSPTHVLVEVPAGISGVPDVARTELTVASPAARPLVSRAFGFRAARETVPLPAIPPAALWLDTGFTGNGAEQKVEYALGGRQGTFSAQRITHDPDRRGCHDRAVDRYDNSKVALAPGFEVVSIEWSYDQPRNRETASTHETGFGAYRFGWDDSTFATLQSGAQRVYFKKSVHPLAVVAWVATMGHLDAFKPGRAICTSRYVATVMASGPRGLRPVP